MAQVSITHHYNGADTTTFTVDVEASAYPDALDQARATVMRMYRDCVLGAEDVDDGQ